MELYYLLLHLSVLPQIKRECFVEYCSLYVVLVMAYECQCDDTNFLVWSVLWSVGLSANEW